MAARHTTLIAEHLPPGSVLHTWLRDRGGALRAHVSALFTRAVADGSARLEH